MSGSGGGAPSSAIRRTQRGSHEAASSSWPGWSRRAWAIWAMAARTKAARRMALM
jgi:hypothetical protein